MSTTYLVTADDHPVLMRLDNEPFGLEQGGASLPRVDGLFGFLTFVGKNEKAEQAIEETLSGIGYENIRIKAGN